MFKRIYHILLPLALFIALADTACAYALIPHARTVKVGYFLFDGYHMLDSHGSKSGYGYELMQMLRRYEQWDCVYVGDDKGEKSEWSYMLDMLENGEIDILSSVTKTQERLRRFDFSALPAGIKSTTLTVKAGNTKFDVEDYSNWNGIKVGMLRKNSQNAKFDAFAREKGFSYDVLYFTSEAKMRAALADGAIDALLASSLSRAENSWIIARFDPVPFYVVVKKGNFSLLKELNDALEKLYEDSPNFAELLNNRYYMQNRSGQAFFSVAERRFIKKSTSEHKVFSVLMLPDSVPYSYAGSDGSPRGTYYDITHEIFARTGLSFKITIPKDHTEYWDLLEKSKYDIVATFPNFLNIAEHCHYLTCDPYVYATISALSLKSAKMSKSGIAATTTKLFSDGTILSRLSSGTGILHCGTVAECEDALREKRADLAFLLTDTALWITNMDYKNSFTARKEPIAKIGFCIAVEDGIDRRLFSVLNKSTASIPAQFIENAARRNILLAERHKDMRAFLYDHPLVVSLFAAAIAIIVLLLVMARIALIHSRHEKELNIKLTAAMVETKKATSAKSDFLSRMSHDIRTPLNGILGMTSLAMGEENPATTDEYLSKIDRSGHFLLDLVNDILDISKVESGKVEMHPAPYVNYDMWNYMSSVIQPMCTEKGIKLHLEPIGRKYTVLVDRLRFNRIFFNLLSNAVKFTPRGGHVTFKSQIISEKGDVKVVDFTVRDDGCGMSEEFQKQLFQPFAQEYSATDANRHGSGLGLAIAKQFVELMGGTISVRSRKGEGTEFTVRLPLTVTKATASAVGHEKAVDTSLLAGLRVLVCEDNDINAEIEKALLEKAHITCEVAENGSEGVEKFAASPERYYDAILMDIMMPLMNGLDATKAIRKLDRADASAVPIIAMTANAFTEDIRECLDAGMNVHIAKPVEPEKMYSVLVSLCCAGKMKK